MSVLKKAFKDVKRKSLPYNDGKVGGQDYLDRVAGMQVGEGTKVLRADQSGFWLGAATFAAAPFSVDMEGNVTASSATLGQYLSKTGTSQNMTGDIDLGASNITLDGANKRIIINDGSNNRIVIGDV